MVYIKKTPKQTLLELSFSLDSVYSQCYKRYQLLHCNGQFPTSLRSRHASIQPLVNHMTSDRFQNLREEFKSYPNSEKFKWLWTEITSVISTSISMPNLHLNSGITTREQIDHSGKWRLLDIDKFVLYQFK